MYKKSTNNTAFLFKENNVPLIEEPVAGGRGAVLREISGEESPPLLNIARRASSSWGAVWGRGEIADLAYGETCMIREKTTKKLRNV